MALTRIIVSDVNFYRALAFYRIHGSGIRARFVRRYISSPGVTIATDLFGNCPFSMPPLRWQEYSCGNTRQLRHHSRRSWAVQ